jgi:hypothetical protein
VSKNKFAICSAWIVFVGMLVTIVVTNLPSGSTATTPIHAVTTESEAPPEEVQKQFWATNGETLVKDLVVGKYQIPELSERYMELARAVDQRWGGYGVNFCSVYLAESREAPAFCKLDVKPPKLVLVIPKLMDIAQELEREGGNWRSRFELTIVVGMIHEMEHIATDDYDPTDPLELLVFNEKRAWDRTCRFTLAPLVEKYHLPLPAGFGAYYQEWLKANRDESNPNWDHFIRSHYAPVHANKKKK